MPFHQLLLPPASLQTFVYRKFRTSVPNSHHRCSLTYIPHPCHVWLGGVTHDAEKQQWTTSSRHHRKKRAVRSCRQDTETRGTLPPPFAHSRFRRGCAWTRRCLHTTGKYSTTGRLHSVQISVAIRSTML